jgi:hypothetical protein
LALYLLYCREANNFRNSFFKLRIEDLVNTCKDADGAFVAERLIAALEQFLPVDGESNDADGGAVGRLFRRLKPYLIDFAQDKHAAYVVEALYSHSPIGVREQIVQTLLPLMAPRKRPRVDADSADPDESGKMFIAGKVLQHCCVEQYKHRPDEWRKTIERHAHVKKLMRRILMEECE